MTATAFTVVTSASFGDGVANAGFEAVDQANGNTFANTGRTVLIVNNASGGSVNMTITGVGPNKYTVNDTITKTPAGPITTGNHGFYGPFPTAIYGTTITLAWDTGTSITAAVVELAETPI